MGKILTRKTQSWSIGQRIRNMREHQNWSQTRLAQELDKHEIRVSISSINRWENDKVLPGPYYREMLCKVFHIDTEELFSQPDIHIEKDAMTTSETNFTQSIWNVPHLRNHYFTGRDSLLEHLHEMLTSHKVGALIALCGLGGIGKTQMAVEYVYRHLDEYETVLWIRADTRQILRSDFIRLADLFDLPEKETGDEKSIITAVMRWLHTHTRWLLIVDNVDDLEQVIDLLPMRGEGKTLLTTRSYSTGSNIQGIELDTLEAREGALLILRRAKLLNSSKELDQASEEEQRDAERISEVLGGLPLALDQVGAYIEENQCSLAGYLALYLKRATDLLKRQGRMYSFSYPYTVATTWNTSFARLEQAHPGAADLLRLCAFLPTNSIPESTLLAGYTELGPALCSLISDPLAWNEAIGALRRFSLVHRTTETGMLKIHQLVQFVLKETMDAETYQQWSSRALKIVNATFLADREADI